MRSAAARCLLAFGLATHALYASLSGTATPRGSASEQTEPLAFVDVTVVPMTSDEILPSHTVVIRDGRVVELGPSAAVTVPPGTKTISGSGRYLVPGLVDFHVHPRAESELEAYLRHGVTTVVVMRGTETALGMRLRSNVGRIVGPRVLTAGPLVDGEPPIWPGPATQVVTTKEDARAIVDMHCRAGFDFVKIYNNLSPDLLGEIVKGAHGCGIPVAGHLPRQPVRENGLTRALDAGLDLIAHGEEIFFTHLGGGSDATKSASSPIGPERITSAVRRIADARAAVIPNLSFIAMTARMLEDVAAVFADPEFTLLTPAVQDMWHDQNPTRRKDLDAFRQREQVKRRAVTAMTLQLQQQGVLLLAGTDASAPGMYPGKSMHVELQELVASGLTAREAFAAATHSAGRFFAERLRTGQRRTPRPDLPRLGTITRGGPADLLLLRRNPLEDIQAVGEIDGVVVRGRWLPQ
jgi:imidazolonepropionase-like amidohydrolase